MSANPTAGSVARRAAREFGDRALLIAPTAQLTFAEADERSRALARRLLALGVGKGTRVGLHFGYTPEYVVSLASGRRVLRSTARRSRAALERV